jgi:hypothetical protein
MESLNEAVGKLLQEPRYADLRIRCRGVQFRVHRNIVCARSERLAQDLEDTNSVNVYMIEPTEPDR